MLHLRASRTLETIPVAGRDTPARHRLPAAVAGVDGSVAGAAPGQSAAAPHSLRSRGVARDSRRPVAAVVSAPPWRSMERARAPRRDGDGRGAADADGQRQPVGSTAQWSARATMASTAQSPAGGNQD